MQHNSHSPAEAGQFRVQVGHATVLVESDTPAAAIREARRRLCEEMPRMWDVIHTLADCRFEVFRESA